MSKEFTLSEAWEGFSTEKKTYHLRRAVENLLERVENLELAEMARADLEDAGEELSKKDLEAAAKKYINSAKKRLGDDHKKIYMGLGPTFRKAKDGGPVKIAGVELSDDDISAFKKEVKKQLGMHDEEKGEKKEKAPSKKKKTSKTEEELKADTNKKESGGSSDPENKGKAELIKKTGPSFLESARVNAGLLNLVESRIKRDKK